MGALARVAFKAMELSLGVRPVFTLETENPLFVNFVLRDDEIAKVRDALPPGFELLPLRFTGDDAEPAYVLSYNLYAIRYPKKEMAGIRKVRCEINTFVRDAEGREGVFVFGGSPFVSRDEERTPMGRVADAAESMVMRIYGCGRLTGLRYDAEDARVRVAVEEPDGTLVVDAPIASGATTRLSEDYARFNDVSFFAGGRTYDLVTVDSAFGRARLERVDGAALLASKVDTPFVQRPPDVAYVHRGTLRYVVSALHDAATNATPARPGRSPEEPSKSATRAALGAQLLVMAVLVAFAAARPEQLADLLTRPDLYVHAKFVHVLSVTLFFANVVLGTVWEARSLASRNMDVIRHTYRTVTWLDAFFTAPLILLAVTSGLVLASVLGGLFSIGWLTLAFALFVLSGLVWLTLDIPTQYRVKRLFGAAAQGAGAEVPAELTRLLRFRLKLNVLAIVPLLAVFVLMVHKPNVDLLAPLLSPPRKGGAPVMAGP